MKKTLENFNPIFVIDLIALGAIIVTILPVILKPNRKISRIIKLNLVIFLFIIFVTSIIHVFEWLEPTNTQLDIFEDYVELFLPFFWGFFFYAFIQKLNQKVLERNRRLIDLLLDLFSHDLSNSQQYKLWNLELLEYKLEGNKRYMKYLSNLYKSIILSNNLIVNVKLLKSLQVKRIKSESQNLRSILKTASERILEMFDFIPIEFEFQAADFYVEGHSLLERVFINVFSNSIKYSTLDEPTKIKMELKKDELQGKVYIKIKDSIPDEKRNQHVEFNRLDLEESGNFSGTGLELSLSKKILEYIGGSIDARKDPQLVIMITLPLANKTD